ncbi:MAG: MarR family winged helix-turn-helix transcriptional regulator [Nakamurella sp.]
MAVADLHADPSRELAARIVPLGRALILAEMPLLQANGLGMWDYIVLAALRRSAVPTQLELARLTGRDKTRIISNLDDLERAGFVSRARDSADRRATRVEITATGTDVVRSCHTAIVAMEDELLVGVPDLDRQAFLRVLDALTGQVDQINGSR